MESADYSLEEKLCLCLAIIFKVLSQAFEITKVFVEIVRISVASSYRIISLCVFPYVDDGHLRDFGHGNTLDGWLFLHFLV